MTGTKVQSTVRLTLAATLGCSPEALDGPDLTVVEWQEVLGRLRYPVPSQPLTLVAGLGGAVVSCTAERRLWVEEHLADLGPNHLISGTVIAEIRDLVAPDGQEIYGPALASVTASDWLAPVAVPAKVEIRHFEGPAVAELYVYPGFRNALGYTQDDPRPDILASAAFVDGEPVGMAGASADSEAMWQVGVDVAPQWQGRGLGACLVSLVSRQVLAHARVPFYTTGVANLRSQRLAARVGYRPTWSELRARDRTAGDRG